MHGVSFFPSHSRALELPVETGLHRRTNMLRNILSQGQGDRKQKVQNQGNMVIELPFSSRYGEEDPSTLGQYADNSCCPRVLIIVDRSDRPEFSAISTTGTMLL
jgi:hypothetical protein